jgi:hypothetical protein
LIACFLGFHKELSPNSISISQSHGSIFSGFKLGGERHEFDRGSRIRDKTPQIEPFFQSNFSERRI